MEGPVAGADPSALSGVFSIQVGSRVGFLGGRHLVGGGGAEQPTKGRYFMRGPLLARPECWPGQSFGRGVVY